MLRRKFLQMGLLSSTEAVLRRHSAMKWITSAIEPAQSAAMPDDMLGPSALQPYVTPLSIPQTIRATSGEHLTLPIRQGFQKVHRDIKPTSIWGYGGTWPGPTIRV